MDAKNFLFCSSFFQIKNNLSGKIFNYSNQRESKPFMLIKFIKTSPLVLVLVCVNFREAQAREGLLVTVEQRVCEEIQ